MVQQISAATGEYLEERQTQEERKSMMLLFYKPHGPKFSEEGGVARYASRKTSKSGQESCERDLYLKGCRHTFL
jgi:hypothetical protein